MRNSVVALVLAEERQPPRVEALQRGIPVGFVLKVVIDQEVVGREGDCSVCPVSWRQERIQQPPAMLGDQLPPLVEGQIAAKVVRRFVALLDEQKAVPLSGAV